MFSKTLEHFLEQFEQSLDFLVSMGHVNAWNYTYREYKRACKNAREFERRQVVSFATAISLAFGGKKAVRKYLEGK